MWSKQPFCTSYWGGRATQDAMYSTAYLSTADWYDTKFSNEQFDQLLVVARGELDVAKRTAMYGDMGAIVSEEGGLICPMFNNFIDATSDKVAGYNGPRTETYCPKCIVGRASVAGGFCPHLCGDRNFAERRA